MLTFLLSLLGAIPGIGNIVTFVVGKVYDAKVQITTARIGGDTAVATELIKATAVQNHENAARMGAFASNKYLAILLIAFAGIPLVYGWKVVVFDNIFCPYWYGEACFTAAIRGDVAAWMNSIVMFMFGSVSALSLGHMYFNRKQ